MQTLALVVACLPLTTHALAIPKSKGFGATPARKPKKTKAPKGEAASSLGKGEAATSSSEIDAAMALLSARSAFEARIAARAPEIVAGLGCGADGRLAVIDGLLGADACAALRGEAERVHAGALAGGGAGGSAGDVSRTRAELLDPEDFARCPRVVAAALAIPSALAGPLADARGGAALSSDCAANMLSCYARGGAFPVHVDNHGGDDRRVFGCIYYMNPDHDPAAGGSFLPWRRRDGFDGAALRAEDLEPRAPVAPLGDRLVVFEADTLAHSVAAYADDAYRRYALTVWITADAGADLDAVLRPNRRALSPTATHAGMAVAERDRAG